MFEGYDQYDFNESFRCEDDCKKYLFDLKWKDGFKCLKCGCAKSWKGRRKFHLRCSNCWYDESATANTVFHKIKIPLLNAFGMAFRISTSKKASSCLGLSRDYAVSKDSAWLFKRKSQEAVKEIFAEPPRYHYKKELLLEGRRVNSLDVASKDCSLTPSNCFSGSKKLSMPRIISKERIGQAFSGFEGRSRHILEYNFRIWVNGVHHHCSDRYLSGYLAEYFFRYSNRKEINLVWHRLIECFLKGRPYYHRAIET